MEKVRKREGERDKVRWRDWREGERERGGKEQERREKFVVAQTGLYLLRCYIIIFFSYLYREVYADLATPFDIYSSI